MSSNKLKRIDPNLLEDLNQLKILNLNLNDLEGLSSSIIQLSNKLDQLLLASNPIYETFYRDQKSDSIYFGHRELKSKFGEKAYITKTQENIAEKNVKQKLIQKRLYWNFSTLKLLKKQSIPTHKKTGNEILDLLDSKILPMIKCVEIKLKTNSDECLNKKLFRNYVEFAYFPAIAIEYSGRYTIKKENFEKIKDYLEFIILELSSDKQLEDIDDLNINFNDLCKAIAECQDSQLN